MPDLLSVTTTDLLLVVFSEVDNLTLDLRVDGDHTNIATLEALQPQTLWGCLYGVMGK